MFTEFNFFLITRRYYQKMQMPHIKNIRHGLSIFVFILK